MECRPKGLDDDDADVEPDQFLSDLPPLDRADSQNAATSAAGLQPTPSAAPASAVSEPHERRAQVGASPYLAPFTPSGSPPQSKTPVASKGRGANSSSGSRNSSSNKSSNMTTPSHGSSSSSSSSTTTTIMKSSSGTTTTTAATSRDVKPQLQPMPKDGRHAGLVHPVLLQDDVVKHLPPRVLETLVDIVATLDQLTDGVADFRPDQLNFLSEKATRYVELLQQADQAAATYDADIPLQVLQYVIRGVVSLNCTFIVTLLPLLFW